MPTIEERNDAWIADARAMLDWLEQHPEFLPPYCPIRLDIFVASKEELAEAARKMGRAEKSALGGFFTVSKKFGEHSLEVSAARELVCRRVVTGVREIPEEIRPARTEEIVDWVCDEPLLKPTHEAVA